MTAKLQHKSLCVKDLIVKFCLQNIHKNAIFVKKFSHCKILGNYILFVPVRLKFPII